MSLKNKIKFQSLVEFWEYLPENERLIADVLRQIILENLPKTCCEKLTNNVPYFFGRKRICMIWPSAIPGGGIKRGVLLGFCKGNKLKDISGYLEHGTNKRIFYKIFNSPEEIDEHEIILLLKDAIGVDERKQQE